MSWQKYNYDRNRNEYNDKAICDNKVYAKKLDNSHLLGFYYVVS